MAGITLSIEVDDKGTVKVKQFADESKKAFKEMTEGPKAAQGPLNSLKESWIGLTAKVAAAAATVYGVSRAIASFVNEAAEAEQIENRLRFALETTGYTWQYAKTAVDEFANSIQATTRFSDEQARQALTDLMMYTNDFARAQMGAKLAMDMSVRIGQDLGSISRLIGMAMSGNVEMLGRYIPQLRNLDSVLGSNATMAEKAAYAMKILKEKFGGTAQADLNSYAGTVAQFKNAWSDLKEELGTGFLPVAKSVLQYLTDIIKAMRERAALQEGGFFGGWGKAPPGSAYMAAATKAKFGIEEGLPEPMKRDIFPEIKMKSEEIEKEVLAFRKLVAEAERLSDLGKMPSWLDSVEQIASPILRDITDLDLNLNKIIGDANRLRELGEMPSWLDSIEQIPKRILPDLNQLNLELNKLIAEAENLSNKGQMPSWIDALEESMGTFRENWRANLNLMQTTWVELGQNISNVWSSNMVNIIRSAGSMTDKIKSFFQSIGDIFLSTISKMITQWLIFGSITGKKEAGGGWASGGLWSGILGSITSLFHQEGGIFTRPTVGIIGEGGPEAVIPLKSGKIPIESSEPKVVNNINIWTNDVDSFRRYLMANKDLLEGVALGAYAESKRLNKIQTRG